MSVRVHKAVEPDNLTVKGKKRLAAMLAAGEYIVQPKHDGVYCQIVHVDGAFRAFSRTGESLLSVPQHILAQFAKFSVRWRFIGELWKPYTEHSVLNGMARKRSPQDALELHLFDMVHDEDPLAAYAERHGFLRSHPWLRGVEVIQNIDVPDADMEYLYELAAKIKAKPSAYDGLMLKDSKGLFVPGPGKDGGAIKVKPRASGDFRVIGTTPGKGNREGGIGALIVDLGGGVTCEVGAGLTFKDVYEGDFANAIVEVEYLGITKDGRLREPAYKSTRFDKAEADVLACNVPGGGD